MIQTSKEYQRDYFKMSGYVIYENIQEAAKAFFDLCPQLPSVDCAIDRITNDTNCDWVVLNDGSVAVLPLVFQNCK